MRGLRAVPAFLCTILLAGCWRGSSLYAFEPPFLQVIDESPLAHARLVGAAVLHGYLPRFAPNVAGEPVAALVAAVASGRYSAVVVSPLLSFQWHEFVPRAPGTRFVLIDVPAPAQARPPNAVFLTYNRAPAFELAGRIAGEAARSRGATAQVGILVGTQSGLAPEEQDAFARGVAQSASGAPPLIEIVPSPADQATVRAAVSRMRNGGVEVFLLGLGDRDPMGLEALRDLGGRAVVSDWESSGSLPQQVLASVETDFPGGIARALGALRTGIAVVEGPVRVVRGRKI